MIKNALKCWGEFSRLIENQKPMLFLDYDGTLSPIVSDPDKAFLPPETKACLERLCAAEDVNITIISGRALDDLKTRVQIKNMIYVGNHGFQLEGPRIQHVHPEAERFVSLFQKIEEILRKNLQPIPGIHIENKIYTLSIHYRGAAEADIARAREIFTECIEPFLKEKEAVICEGKKVWEVRPSLVWDKGKMVLWLLARTLAHVSEIKPLPIYIGDDVTDEHALEVIQGRGIGIKVTEDPAAKTFASWVLRNPGEVLLFLKKLETFKFPPPVK